MVEISRCDCHCHCCLLLFFFLLSAFGSSSAALLESGFQWFCLLELFDSLLLLSLLLLPFSFLIGLYSYTVCLSFIVFKWDENSFFFFGRKGLSLD